MSQIFKYLSTDEEKRLLETGGLRHFEAEETILSQGSEHSAIYVIGQGQVRVERDSAGFSLELTNLGRGQIFGEMSFLEGAPASASVVADEGGADVYLINGDQVEALLNSDPGYFGRFYKSLADILSRRLRDTSGLFTEQHWRPA